MKNKGMHQQPNAFTPSTGNSAPQGKTFNKGGNQPAGHHGHPAPTPWNKPQAAPATTTPVNSGSGKNFGKSGGKKAA